MPFQFHDDFAENIAALQQGARQVEQKVAQRVKERAQAAAPVKTGKLRDSAQVTQTEEGAKVEFTAPYAAEVETGAFDVAANRFRAGKHFLAGAFNNSQDDLEEECGAMLHDLGAK